MVSLNVSLNFDDDDCEEASPLIGLSTPSRSLPIVISTAVGCLTMCGLEAVVFVPTFPFHFYLLDDTHAPWSFLCLLHVFVWLVLMLVYVYGEKAFRRVRLRGYLGFYRDTQFLRRVPVVTFALMNAVLLCISSFWATNDDADMDRKTLLQILVSFELVICLPCYMVHLVKCIRFNKSRDPPDVMSEFQVVNANTSISSDIDMDSGLDSDALLEKQSDMLKYMKQYTTHLQHEVFSLQAQITKLRKNNQHG
eukprot:m.18313 g.18313  ORF g.18313 m.18313 type:complete len:251 (-) comp8291_c0_seq3:290-1042(-)